VRVAGILGTGVQAYWQARALFSERKFERLLIWGRDREKARVLRDQFAPWLPGVKIEVIDSVKKVVEAAEVLVTATTAREPIVRESGCALANTLRLWEPTTIPSANWTRVPATRRSADRG